MQIAVATAPQISRSEYNPPSAYLPLQSGGALNKAKQANRTAIEEQTIKRQSLNHHEVEKHVREKQLDLMGRARRQQEGRPGHLIDERRQWQLG